MTTLLKQPDSVDSNQTSEVGAQPTGGFMSTLRSLWSRLERWCDGVQVDVVDINPVESDASPQEGAVRSGPGSAREVSGDSRRDYRRAQ